MQLSELLTYEYNEKQELNELHNVCLHYKAALENISKEVKELTYIRDRNQNEHQEVIKKMQAMQESNLSKTKNFKFQIQSNTNDYESKIAEINEAHEKYLKQTQIKHQQQVKAIEGRMQKLREGEKKVEENQKEEATFLSTIRRKSGDLIEMQYAHHDLMNKEELRQQQQNKQLFLKNLDVIKELKKNVKAYANEVVFEDKELNEEKNYELKVKLLTLQDQIARLRTQRNGILKAKNQNKINLSLNEEELEEYKVVGSIQKSKIKSYSEKIEIVKKTITEESKKLQNRIDQKSRRWQNQMKGLKLKLFNLEKQKQQLRINLQKYRTLGETILMQRQEVEEFFLMAIQSCKQNMEDSGPSENYMGRQYGEKVDIQELKPKDRHRILTNLYTKLALASK